VWLDYLSRTQWHLDCCCAVARVDVQRLLLLLLLLQCQQVPFILDQLEQIQLRGGAHPFAHRPLVILADKDKEELDALVSPCS
jgi:hypothetical protein